MVRSQDSGRRTRQRRRIRKYPGAQAGYAVYLLVLLTLLPIVPVAALAAYMPAFYAYYVPCIAPFVLALAYQGSRPEMMTALLLVLMMGAMVTFAHRHSRSLAEAIRFRLQLAQTTRELEQVIRHKSRFIAAASHDLRQPVHAMGLFLALLRDNGLAPHKLQWYIHIEAALNSLRSLLNNILELSKLEARIETAHLVRFDVAALIEKMRREFAPLAEQKDLEFRCISRHVIVESDPDLLERILRNLLSNALKYTRRGGFALICRPRETHVLLQVIDTGSGIAPGQLHEIFDEFTQIDNPGRNDARGFGLGLAIVKRLTDLLGHAVHVRSNVAKGSTFGITVYRAHGPVASGQQEKESTPRAVSAARLVVVLDDDEAVAEGTAALIRQWGHRTVVDTTAVAAFATVQASLERPDLLVVDYGLVDGSTGLDAVALFNARFDRKLPAIIVTGDTTPERIRQAFGLGHVLLHKPVDPHRLRACMESIWATGRD